MKYSQLLEWQKKVRPGKDARRLHKELKKYGSGLFWEIRYPYLSIYFLSIYLSLFSIIISMLTIILKV